MALAVINRLHGLFHFIWHHIVHAHPMYKQNKKLSWNCATFCATSSTIVGMVHNIWHCSHHHMMVLSVQWLDPSFISTLGRETFDIAGIIIWWYYQYSDLIHLSSALWVGRQHPHLGHGINQNDETVRLLLLICNNHKMPKHLHCLVVAKNSESYKCAQY